MNKYEKNMTFMQETLDYFNMTAPEFSEFSGIPKKTIDGWKLNGTSQLGEVALRNITKVKFLEEEFLKDQEKLIEKCNDFDKLLDIQKKYLN